GQVNQLARRTGEHLSHEEGLRQEAFDLTSARNRELVLFRKLIHAENGDDVLQRLVALEGGLNRTGNPVVLFTNDHRIEHARGGVQRIHGRVDTLFSDRAVKRRGRVKVGKRGRRRRVGQVVGGNVNGLHRGDRTL